MDVDLRVACIGLFNCFIVYVLANDVLRIDDIVNIVVSINTISSFHFLII